MEQQIESIDYYSSVRTIENVGFFKLAGMNGKEPFCNLLAFNIPYEHYERYALDKAFSLPEGYLIAKNIQLGKAIVLDGFKDKPEEMQNEEDSKFIWIGNKMSWKEIKRKLFFDIKRNGNLMFMAHDQDTIYGKPQLINETKQTIPLVIEAEKTDADGKKEFTWKFIDDRFDKRYDGYEKRTYDESFYIYRVICNDLEYLVFSKERLDPEHYTFHGMAIKMQTLPQITKELKVRSLSHIFFARKCENSVKILPKDELVKFTKKLHDEIGLDADGFINLTFLHPDGKVYNHTPTYTMIRIAQLLSGKYEGYPLSVGNMGPLGKGKTKELEALDFKFNESKGICEAGNSTPKVLVPSFKEKPASPGYILECNRIALIDELMKMVANANNGTRQGEMVRNSLGQLNMILEHKKRTIGSGNDNSLVAKATAKCIFATNPLPGKHYLADHLTIVDETTMSRILWYVQDQEEQHFIQNNKPQKCGNTYANIYTNKKEGYMISIGVTTHFYIQIYDSCQDFVSDYDEDRVREIFKNLSLGLQDPMKSVWKGRGLHHTILLLDGLIKFRCLFKDFDDTFKAKDEDYNMLEALLSRIISSWNTNVGAIRETL